MEPRARASCGAPRGEAKAWIASLEGRERARTGIPSLRVRFNRVFGYSIEVSNAHAAKVPAEYVRRQTLVGAERYVTTELKEHESRALGAEERMAALEFDLFVEIRARVAAEAEALLRTARALGTLDALAALAEQRASPRLDAPRRRRGPRARDRGGPASRPRRRGGLDRSRPTT